MFISGTWGVWANIYSLEKASFPKEKKKHSHKPKNYFVIIDRPIEKEVNVYGKTN